jgi:hypothetical protein
MLSGLLSAVCLFTAAVAATDQDRDDRSGFRERIPCIETGKFYRDGVKVNQGLMSAKTTFPIVINLY